MDKPHSIMMSKRSRTQNVTVFDSIFIKYPKSVNWQRQEAERLSPGAGEGEKVGLTA